MAAELNGFQVLTGAQIKPAAEMLARAFCDSPGRCYYFPDKYERTRVLPYILQYSLRRGLLYGEVHVTSSHLEGVAVWLPSNNMYMNQDRIVRAGGLTMMENVGKENMSRFIFFAEYLGSVHKLCAPFKRWYLLGIGINPDDQGKGYAALLLKSMFTHTDGQSIPCYLETQNEKNLPIYQHFGFRVVDKSIIPVTSVTNWAMLRGDVVTNNFAL